MTRAEQGYPGMNKTQQRTVTDFCISLLLKTLIIPTSSLFFTAEGSEELGKFVVNIQEELDQTEKLGKTPELDDSLQKSLE